MHFPAGDSIVYAMENETIDLYTRAYQASLRVHYLLDGDDDLSVQAKRASRSVVASIAVADSVATGAEETFIYLEEAFKQAVELNVWLDFCKDLEAIDAVAAQSLKDEYGDIIDDLADAVTAAIEDFEDFEE